MFCVQCSVVDPDPHGSGSFAWIRKFCLDPDPEILFRIHQNMKGLIKNVISLWILYFVYCSTVLQYLWNRWIRNFCLDPYQELGKFKAGSGINHSGSITLCQWFLLDPDRLILKRIQPNFWFGFRKIIRIRRFRIHNIVMYCLHFYRMRHYSVYCLCTGGSASIGNRHLPMVCMSG